MIYRNSFKLIFSNSSMIWKLLVYFVMSIAVIVTINYFLTSSMYANIGIAEAIQQVPEAFTQFIKTFDVAAFLIAIKNVMEACLNIIISNFAEIWLYVVLAVVLGLLVPSMIINFYLMATCNTLHFYMGSNLNFGFVNSCFMKFWKNIRYQLARLITLLPLKLITFYLVIKSFGLLEVNLAWIRLLAPFITMLIYVVLTGFRIAIFSGWVPYMVVKNANVFNGLINGFKCIRKRFFKILGTGFAVVLTIIFISVFGLFTFGVSLIITAPAAYLFIATFNMVSFYTATGLRYYIDSNNIYAPKKTEMIESYKIYKNII